MEYEVRRETPFVGVFQLCSIGSGITLPKMKVNRPINIAALGKNEEEIILNSHYADISWPINCRPTKTIKMWKKHPRSPFWDEKMAWRYSSIITLTRMRIYIHICLYIYCDHLLVYPLGWLLLWTSFALTGLWNNIQFLRSCFLSIFNCLKA